MNTPTALHTLWAFLSDAPILGRLFLASVEMPILAVLVWLSIRAGLVQSPRWRALLWLIVLVKPLTVLAIGSFVPVIRIAPIALPPTDIPAPITVTTPIQTPHSDLSPSSATSIPPQPIFDPPPAVTPPPSQPGCTPRNILQAWLLGLGLMGAYSLLDRIRLYRLLFHATPIAADSAAPADLSVRYRELAARLNLKRVPRLFLTNTLESPALAGTIRPVILLPAWLGHEGWTPKLEWALRHELMHWHLCDPWANGLRQLTQIVFFFHPVIWWAGKQWQTATELACDRAVIATEQDVDIYAGSLFQLLSAIHGRRQRLFAGALFATRTQIGTRIAALLGNPLRYPARLHGWGRVALAAIIIIALGTGGSIVVAQSETVENNVQANIRKAIDLLSVTPELERDKVEMALDLVKTLPSQPALAELCKELESNVDTRRQSAISILGEIQWEDPSPAFAPLRTLLSHQEAKTRDMAALVLKKMTTPNSFSEGRILIHVKDAQGQPAKGVEVQTVIRNNSEGPRVRPLTKNERRITDDQGMVIFEGLTSGTYLIRAIRGTEGAFGGAGINANQQQADVTMTLKHWPVVKGSVKDSDGMPLSGVTLVAERVLPLAVTDRNGTFQIKGLNCNNLNELSLAKVSYSWQILKHFRDTDTLDITMPLGISLEGTVTLSDGQSAPNISLNYAGSVVSKTDDQGHFRTWPMPPGTKVQINGYHKIGETRYSIQKVIELKQRPTQVEQIELKQYLATGITGKVIRRDTNAGVDAKIMFDTSESFPFPREKTKTKSDGSFEVKDLPAQILYIAAQPLDPVLYSAQDVVAVDLSKGESVRDLSFTIDEGCAIRGRVLDTAGNPVQAGLTVSPLPRFRSIRTNKDGAFLFGNLPHQGTEYTLTVQTENNANKSIPLGPIQKGQVLDNVEIRLDTPKPMGLIQGTILDVAGKPVSSAEIIPQPSEGTSTSIADTAGVFEMKYRDPGSYKFGIYVVDKTGPAEHRKRLFRKFHFVEGDTITVEAGGNYRHRIVIDLEPRTAMAGIVKDEEGTPLNADVIALAANRYKRQGEKGSDGWFYVPDPPTTPFLLAVTSPGYQGVLLKSGKHFKPGDLDMHITLKKGPFPENTALFAPFTGQNAEKLEKSLLDVDLQRLESEFRALAKETSPEKPAHETGTTKMGPATVQIRVTDVNGLPIQRIFVEDARAYDINFGEITASLVHPTGPKRLLENSEGVYSVENIWFPGFHVSAEGMALVYLPLNPGTEPVSVTLNPASTVVIKVEDYAGKPVANVPIGPSKFRQQLASTDFYGLPRTDSNGTVTFEKVPPGRYGYSAFMPRAMQNHSIQMRIPTISLEVKPGQTYNFTLRYGKAPKGTVDAIYQAWWEALAADQGLKEDAPRPVKPEGDVKGAMAKLIETDLNGLCGQEQYEMKETCFLATMAEELALKELLPALKDVLHRWKVDAQNMFVSDQASMALTSALAVLGGDDSVDTLADTASDDTAPYFVRRDALIALGKLGSDKAVAAFRSLRDNAYEKPGAPKRKDSYTNEEKMAETVIMVFEIIPGKKPAKNIREAFTPQIDRAWVSEDSKSGKILYQGNGLSMEIHLKRIGNEWMVYEIGNMIAS